MRSTQSLRTLHSTSNAIRHSSNPSHRSHTLQSQSDLETVSQSVTVNVVPPLTPPDTTPPTAPSGLTGSAINQTQINLTWTASTDNVAVADYDIFRNGTQIGSPSGTTYQDTGLSAGTPYTYYVEAVDTSGNISAASASVTATTTAADITPPTVTITAPTGQLAANTTSTTLSVTTNENATCAWSTLAGQAFASMTTFATTGGTSHSTTLTGLSNGSSYTDYVKCKDTSGNISTNSTASFSVASSGGTTYNGGSLGIEADGIAYWSSEQPFLNIFKLESNWAASDAKGNSYQDSSDFNLDSNGYPTSMQGKGAAAGVTFTAFGALLNRNLGTNNLTSPPYYPAGEYVVLYDGQGTITYQFDGVKNVASSTPGRDVLEVSNPSNAGIEVNITSTDPNYTGNYIRNIRVVYAPYESLLDSGEIFNPTFIDRIKPFGTIRFMDWGDTNGATAYNGTADPTIINSGNWSDRTVQSDAFWGVANGAPVETMVALLNETGANGWFNMPVALPDPVCDIGAQ